MFKLIRSLFVFTILLLMTYFLVNGDISIPTLNEKIVGEINDSINQTKKTDDPSEKQEEKLSDDLSTYIGKEGHLIKEVYGEPVREEKDLYGHTVYHYQVDEDQYVQFALKDGYIASLFVLGSDVKIPPIESDMSYREVGSHFNFSRDIEFYDKQIKYTFHLDDEDIKIRPLVQLDDELFMQLYFDTFTDELIAIRLVDIETMLLYLPYAITYYKELPKIQRPSGNQLEQAEKLEEVQIFELTNTYRSIHNLPLFEWDEQVRDVAYKHSRDMYNNDYFSHNRLDGTGLKTRFLEGDISFRLAGENIASNYFDGLEALIGWINSKGHREALLNDSFTHLGVGVYQKHYTQNFLQK